MNSKKQFIEGFKKVYNQLEWKEVDDGLGEDRIMLYANFGEFRIDFVTTPNAAGYPSHRLFLHREGEDKSIPSDSVSRLDMKEIDDIFYEIYDNFHEPWGSIYKDAYNALKEKYTSEFAKIC